MSTVLIIEDDSLIADLERDYLEAAGFDVVVELNGESGLRQALAGSYDAMVLDVMLPGKSGFDICREVRKELNLPVIMVTARKEDVDKIRGLGLGADDYLVKPFSPAELVARVKAHIQIHERLLEQKKERLPRSIDIRNLTIYPEERRVFSSGKEVGLTNKEFELLMFLAENPNIVFSKDTIFDRIWGMDAAGNTATVTVHINRLPVPDRLKSGFCMFIKNLTFCYHNVMRIGYDKTVPERVPKFFILNCTTYEMQPFPENEVSGAGSLIFYCLRRAAVSVRFVRK